MGTFVETSDAQAWHTLLESYLEQGDVYHTYFHWMRQYVSVFQLSRWLSEYASASSKPIA